MVSANNLSVSYCGVKIATLGHNWSQTYFDTSILAGEVKVPPGPALYLILLPPLYSHYLAEAEIRQEEHDNRSCLVFLPLTSQ